MLPRTWRMVHRDRYRRGGGLPLPCGSSTLSLSLFVSLTLSISVYISFHRPLYLSLSLYIQVSLFVSPSTYLYFSLSPPISLSFKPSLTHDTPTLSHPSSLTVPTQDVPGSIIKGCCRSIGVEGLPNIPLINKLNIGEVSKYMDKV